MLYPLKNSAFLLEKNKKIEYSIKKYKEILEFAHSNDMDYTYAEI